MNTTHTIFDFTMDGEEHCCTILNARADDFRARITNRNAQIHSEKAVAPRLVNGVIVA